MTKAFRNLKKGNISAQTLEKRDAEFVAGLELLKKVDETAYNTMTEQSFKVLATCLEDEGLRLEDTIKVVDGGAIVSHAGAASIKATGFPHPPVGNDSIDVCGLNRNDDCGYLHHLSEVDDDDNDRMNLWAAASVLISVASGWGNLDATSPENAKSMIVAAVSRVAPTVSVDELMYMARFHDASLLRLVSLVKNGLEVLATQ